MTDYESAPCIGNSELFMDNDTGEGAETTGYVFPHEAEAKALCATCPFLVRCLAENKSSDMIVGGTTPAERRRRKA